MHAAAEFLTSPAGGAATRPHSHATAGATVRSHSPRPLVDEYSWFLTHCPKAPRAARRITAAVLAGWSPMPSSMLNRP